MGKSEGALGLSDSDRLGTRHHLGLFPRTFGLEYRLAFVVDFRISTIVPPLQAIGV